MRTPSRTAARTSRATEKAAAHAGVDSLGSMREPAESTPCFKCRDLTVHSFLSFVHVS